MTQYQKRKEQIRKEAIQWQYDITNHRECFGDAWISYKKNYFKGLAETYGLVREFKKMGII